MAIDKPGPSRGTAGSVGFIAPRVSSDAAVSQLGARLAGQASAFGGQMAAQALQAERQIQTQRGRIEGAAFGARVDANGNPIPIEEQPFNLATAYGRSGFSAAAQTYSASVRSSASAMRQELTAKHPLDAEAFTQAWQVYADETSRVIAPEFRGLVEADLAQIGRNGAINISGAQIKHQRETTKDTLLRDLQLLGDETSQTIYSVGADDPAVAENRMKVIANLDSLVEQNFLTQPEAQNELDKYDDSVTNQTVLAAADKAIATDPVRGIEFGESLKTDPGIDLPPEKKRQLSETVINRALTEMNRRDQARHRIKASIREAQTRRYNGLVKARFESQVPYTPDEIMPLAENGEISWDQATNLMQGYGAQVRARRAEQRRANVTLMANRVERGEMNFTEFNDHPDVREDESATLWVAMRDSVDDMLELQEGERAEQALSRFYTASFLNPVLTPAEYRAILLDQQQKYGSKILSTSEVASKLSQYTNRREAYFKGAEGASGAVEAAKYGKTISGENEQLVLGQMPWLDPRDPVNHERAATWVTDHPGGLTMHKDFLKNIGSSQDPAVTESQVLFYRAIKAADIDGSEVLLKKWGVNKEELEIYSQEYSVGAKGTFDWIRDAREKVGAQQERKTRVQRGSEGEQFTEGLEGMIVDEIERNEGFGSWLWNGFVTLFDVDRATPEVNQMINSMRSSGVIEEQFVQSLTAEQRNYINDSYNRALDNKHATSPEGAVRFALMDFASTYFPEPQVFLSQLDLLGIPVIPIGPKPGQLGLAADIHRSAEIHGLGAVSSFFGLAPKPGEIMQWKRHSVVQSFGEVPAEVQYNTVLHAQADAQLLFDLTVPTEGLPFEIDSWYDVDFDLEMVPETVNTGNPRARIFVIHKDIRHPVVVPDVEGNPRYGTIDPRYSKSMSAMAYSVALRQAEELGREGTPFVRTVFGLTHIDRQFAKQQADNIRELWRATQAFGVFKDQALIGGEGHKIVLGKPADTSLGVTSISPATP